MNKRIAASVLWFVAGWWAWAFIANAISASMLVGLVIGLVLGSVVAVDPLRIIWTPEHSNERPAA